MSAVGKRTLTVVDGGGKSPPPTGGGGEGDLAPWRKNLVLNRDHRIEGSLHNVQLILENDERLAGVFWLDEFANQILLHRDPPWAGGNRHEFTDQDGCELAAWLQHPGNYGMAVKDDLAMKAVYIVARRHRRHPPREYLRALKWDGVKRAEGALVRIFGAEDNEYSRAASLCWLVSAVARILIVDPVVPALGAQVDFMLVLEGEQGKSKTSTTRALFGAPWHVEIKESPANTDFFMLLRGAWCVEIAELQSFRGADVTAVKAAVSRRTDKYRAPYERTVRAWRRECVFVGTTNESEYLTDPTGARRFLPVQCRPDATIDIELARADRDQIWAEAVHLLDGGFKYWDLPKDAQEEQEKRYIEDSWESVLRLWLLGKDDREKAYPDPLQFGRAVPNVRMADAMLWALGVDLAKQTKPDQRRFGDVMKHLGWVTEQKVWERGKPKERRWRAKEPDWADRQLGASASEIGWEGDDVPF